MLFINVSQHAEYMYKDYNAYMIVSKDQMKY